MVRAHELKGGEGSIRVGSTGKVSALMMQELDSVTSSSKTSTSSKRRIQTAPVSISCGASTRRLQQEKASSNSSRNAAGSMNSGHNRTPESIPRKKKNGVQTSQNIPMIGSENISVSNTPNRVEPRKKRSQIVEIVDLGCGRPDGGRSHPISSQLRRISFSKLSD